LSAFVQKLGILTEAEWAQNLAQTEEAVTSAVDRLYKILHMVGRTTPLQSALCL